jgi:circadian clock protein KaiC
MLGGGPPRGSSTFVVGNPSTGKTLLALQFLLDGYRRGEPTLYVGFQETAQQLRAKAGGLGLELPRFVPGRFEFVYRVPAEFDADAIAALIRERVAAGGVKRLVIDSLPDLLSGLAVVDRRLSFLTALMAYTRNAGVTTCCIEEVFSAALPSEARMQAIAYAAYADNIMLLRHLESRAELRRVIAILKMRNSDHDRAIHEFTIGPGGLAILTRLQGGESALERPDPA